MDVRMIGRRPKVEPVADELGVRERQVVAVDGGRRTDEHDPYGSRRARELDRPSTPSDLVGHQAIGLRDVRLEAVGRRGDVVGRRVDKNATGACFKKGCLQGSPANTAFHALKTSVGRNWLLAGQWFCR